MKTTPRKSRPPTSCHFLVSHHGATDYTPSRSLFIGHLLLCSPSQPVYPPIEGCETVPRVFRDPSCPSGDRTGSGGCPRADWRSFAISAAGGAGTQVPRSWERQLHEAAVPPRPRLSSVASRLLPRDSGCPSASASTSTRALALALARPWVVWQPVARSSSEPAAVGRPPHPVPHATAARRLLRPERPQSARAARPCLDRYDAAPTRAPARLVAPGRKHRAGQSLRMAPEPAAISPSMRRKIAPARSASMPALLGRASRRGRPMQPFRP
jgi:hypothetical protein